MSERVLAVIAALLLAGVLGLALLWQPVVQELPLPRAGLPEGGDFTVQTASGPVSLHDFKGKLVLLYFGYTFCPDICPTSLSTISAALQAMQPDEAKQVAVIFISVDPERDTPEHLKEYAGFFDPRFVAGTEHLEKITEITRRYGIFFAAQKSETAGGSYVVDHSAETLVVNENGQLVGKIAHGLSPDQVVETIRKYMKPR